MTWFALVPGLALCVMVFGLFIIEVLQIATRYNGPDDLGFHNGNSLKHQFAEDAE